MAAIPATSRRNTSESQESQQGPRVILTRLPSYRAPRKKSQKSLTSRNRWNPHKHSRVARIARIAGVPSEKLAATILTQEVMP